MGSYCQPDECELVLTPHDVAVMMWAVLWQSFMQRQLVFFLQKCNGKKKLKLFPTTGNLKILKIVS